MDAVATTTLRKRPLSVRTTMDGGLTAPEELGEPVSPSARLVEDFYIVVVMGAATPLNIPALRSGIEAQLARHPHFRSIQVTDKDGNLRWARTTVNVDNHLISPALDPAAVSANPDKVVEDYVVTLSTLHMDWSRPLWEFHLFDFPTSEAAATAAIRVHHSLGDGMSLLTLLMSKLSKLKHRNLSKLNSR